MNINENLKNEVKCEKKNKRKLPVIHFDQPFHPVILYENCLIRIVMINNKTSKIAYWLSSKREGVVRSSLGAPCCVLEQDTFTLKKSTDNTQVAMAPSRHD